MLLYPDVQAKIHKEIDEKIGRGATITFAEASSLPYFGAVLKESWRFNPPAPNGDGVPSLYS
jgi:cytochrome P450 family 78 subfamily A